MAQGKAFTEEQRETIIESLRPFLEMGFSRNKACDFIGLDPTTLSKWSQSDAALSMKLTGWENMINVQAINNLQRAVMEEAKDGSKVDNSWKWSEKRMKDMFSDRIEHTDPNGNAIQPILVEIINAKPKENTDTE
jgi:hypothetical protein